MALVTMKRHLRGRVRREVVTLLESGHEVLVVSQIFATGGQDEFLQGLSHPCLTVELVPRRSAVLSIAGLAGAFRRATWAEPGPRAPAPDVATAGGRRAALLDLPLRGLKRVVAPVHRITLYRHHWRHSEAVVRRWAPGLVHTCDLEGLVGGGRAARRLGVPHVHDCHELYVERIHYARLERRVLESIERRAIRKADAITVVNQSIGEELQRRYGIQATVVRNCAERSREPHVVDVRDLARLERGDRVVLYQGGLSVGRGLHEVVRSAAHYPEGAALVFLGSGPLRPDLERLARDLDLDGRVRFVDAVPPDDLLGITASATVGVVPYQPVSLNNRLALPNKVFEYLVVGVPVVVSDLPELRRIVEGSGAGRTYDPFDPLALAGAVRELLEPEALSLAAERAARYGAENCWENERRVFQGVYEQVLDRRTRGG